MRPTHRISYQCDAFIITTCGQRVYGPRKEIAQHDWVTVWNHGEATCPICTDETTTLDTALLREALQERFPVQSGPMLPKQVDNIFEVLEASYDCSDITLMRRGTTIVAGHVQALYVLTLTRDDTGHRWQDHSLTRLLATAVTEMAKGTVPADDRPHHLP